MPQVLNTNKDVFLSKKDLYERYWKCRDFEITTLWQRAVFLGPFLVMIFTGYGAFFAKCFIANEKVNFLESGFSENHLIAGAIAIMGMLFSILWICMMKGSKAWYEVYERAITAMDTQKDWIFDKDLLNCGAGFKQYKLPGYKNVGRTDKPQFCDYLFSTRGGCFSPSKINIVIGQISLLFWIFVAAFHLLACFSVVVKNGFNPIVFAAVLEAFTIFFVILKVLKSKGNRKNLCDFLGCKSDSLKERDPGVYPKEFPEGRLYILRIVDCENKIEEVVKYPETVMKWCSLDIKEKVGSESLKIVLDKDFMRWGDYPCYASINFKTWCEKNGYDLKIETVKNFLEEEIKPIFDSFRREVRKDD